MTTSTRSSNAATSNDNNNQPPPPTPPPTTTTTAAAAATGATGATGADVAAANTATTPTSTAAAAAIKLRRSHSPSASSNTSTNRVMQADEDFNIRFVNLVRTHKCLYDKKVPEYRNRDNQEKAWVLISEETRESVIHCKERWRNLRACLSRYIKQQNGSDPQHKPYYLTEHMAFLLPFLKSTRNSLDGNNSLATLYQLSQQHHHHQQLYCNNNNNNNNNNNYNNNMKLELKPSISENDDEETIDAFDPAIAASLGLQRVVVASPGTAAVAAAASAAAPPPASSSMLNDISAPSPTPSDTASANSMQNFIPDVQLAEDLIYHPHHHQHHHHHHNSFESSSAKRIKTECEATTTTASYYNSSSNNNVSENTDMEFFRSILPDIAALTPQQRRKFKIGILELIDDVVERYPSQPDRFNGTVNGSGGSNGGGSSGSASGNTNFRQTRRGRDWRK